MLRAGSFIHQYSFLVGKESNLCVWKGGVLFLHYLNAIYDTMNTNDYFLQILKFEFHTIM